MGNCCDSESNDLMRREEDEVQGKIDYNVKDPRFIEILKWPLILRSQLGQ
jgi:hypothetical protein